MIITVLDTETSGLDNSRHEILEVALVSYVLSNEGEFFHLKELNEKIKPHRIHLAHPKALSINGYTEKKWENAKDMSKVLPKIKEMIKESDLLLGQNLIFDLRFLQKASLTEIDFPPYIDTKAMADFLVRKNWLRRSKMDYLVEHYNVEVKGRAHTALVDCYRTYEVFKKLLSDIGDYDLYTFEKPYTY